MKQASGEARAADAEKRWSRLMLTGALVSGFMAAAAVSFVGYAFNKPCTSPQGRAIGYTGCFNWGEWVASVFAIMAAFASIGFIEHAATAAIRSAAMKHSRLEGIGALVLLGLLCLAGALGALLLLAKPWETYQTYDDGRTKSVDEWTIDVWMVFLGYSAVFVFGPLALALVLVLQNVLHPWHWAPAQTSDVETNSESSGNFELEGSSGSASSASATRPSTSLCATSRCLWLVVILIFLWACFLFTAAMTPIWNFSMNSYFKSVSKYAMFYWPVGQLPCSILGSSGEANCVGHGLCREISHWLPGFQAGVDACPWFSFKPFPDCALYYGFLTLFVLCGALAHTRPISWMAKRHIPGPKRLPSFLNPFPDGLSLLEALMVLILVFFFAGWFGYWYWGYDRFHHIDAAHECWTSPDKEVSDKIGELGEPGVAVSLGGSQLKCEQIVGSVPTGRGELHVLCRVSGHMASLAFALTMLPVAKDSILLRVMGLSFERVLHWHRGLGAVSYFAVTAHMLLWWLKWILDGTFVKNLIAIDTQKWLWVTPSWNHYENFSVLMAQVSWVLFTVAMVIAWTCRRRMYRLFYLSHHLALFFVFMGMVHAWSFWFFVLPGLALWWFDRLHRLVASSQPARVVSFTAIPGTDITHLELQMPQLAAQLRPGHFVLVHVPEVCKQSWHPFTANVQSDRVSIFCKAAGPWTQRLRQLAEETQPSGPFPAALCIGPYGSLDPGSYASGPVFLAAGGIGITPVIAVFRDAVRRQVPGVTLLWSIRSLEYLRLPIVEEALFAAAESENASVVIYVSRSRGELPPDRRSVSFRAGRPPVAELAVAAAKGGAADGFAFACGPAAFQDEVKRCCREAGFGKIHVETFLF
ncbi:FRO4 [Symbiodinium sp. CCMP2592]|nr:FRO4 [Symbiodinium sp. CCMP2592]